MASLYARVLRAQGHTVEGIDRGESLSDTTLARAEVVIVAVPMEVAAEVIRSIAPRLSPQQLLVDINSLKKECCEALAGTPAQALGTHPMCGPGVPDFKGQKIIACRVHDGPLVERFLAALRALGADLLEADPDEHDRMMAIVQVLMHFGVIAIGIALRNSGVELERTLAFTSPIYRLELSVIGRLFAQSPDLYAEILMRNPYSAKIRALLRRSIDRLDAVIDSGDRTAFRALFDEDRRFFDAFAEDAMTLSNRIISTLLVSDELK